MSTALVTQDVNMDELKRMGMMFALSGFFDTNGPQDVAVAQMAVKVLAGREIGFGPFAAVNGIHIIKGKPSISANLMAAAVKSSPKYDYKIVTMTDKEVSIQFYENGEKNGPPSTFTAADAAKAGTQNMNKFPRNMLFARAMSNGVRFFCPDVFSGNTVYTPEELGARTDDEGYVIVDRASGEVIESPAQNTNGRQPEPEPDIESQDEVEPLESLASEEDNPFADEPEPEAKPPAKVSAAQLKRLHAVGTEAYGKDWDTERLRLVDFITKGAANSSKDLTPKEADTLIAGMEKRINELAAKVQA